MLSVPREQPEQLGRRALRFNAAAVFGQLDSRTDALRMSGWRVCDAAPPKRNTFSNANRTRDPAMAEALYWQILAHLQGTCPGLSEYGKHAGFIFRLKRNMLFETVKKLPCKGKVLRDELVRPVGVRNSKAYPGLLRMVTAFVVVDGRSGPGC